MELKLHIFISKSNSIQRRPYRCKLCALADITIAFLAKNLKFTN